MMILYCSTCMSECKPDDEVCPACGTEFPKPEVPVVDERQLSLLDEVTTKQGEAA